jgi:general stress protein YciG
MDRAKQREIASKGGKAAHQKGTAHEWTSEEARDAGRKGGIASHQRRREQMGGSSDDTGQTEPDTTRNASSESMRGYSASESMHRPDRSSSSSSSSTSSMEGSREDYSRRDGWSRDE